jgi:hypothetical protein
MKPYSKKRKYKIKLKRLKTRKMKGGELKIKPTDLKNTHLCGGKGDKESAGNEIYTAVNSPFQLNESTLEMFFSQFKKSDNNWFKFAIFNNDDTHYIYIIKGNPLNKHSILLIYGLLQVSKSSEYTELREALLTLLKIREELSIPEGANIEENPIVKQFNEKVAKAIPCMPLIAAGSGTVNDDNSICLNTKSGHYKPTLEIMELAKSSFERITGAVVTIQEKVPKEGLIKRYGNAFDKYSGIC